MSSLEDARREILASFNSDEQQRIVQDLVVDGSLVPGHLKVSCPFGGCSGACSSPSKRVASKPKRAWVCGSSFSHNERLDCCIAYRRLDRGLGVGVSGNRRFPK